MFQGIVASSSLWEDHKGRHDLKSEHWGTGVEGVKGVRYLLKYVYLAVLPA